MQDPKKVITRVSSVSIAVNLALTAFKLLAGIIARSSAMVADAIHSASDILGSFAVLIGGIISSRAPDTEHRYGHEKLECVVSIGMGGLLLIVGAAIGWSGITKLMESSEIAVPGALALIAAAVSVAAKEALYWYTAINAKRISSVSLKAEAWHHRSDALSSVGSFIAILGARLGLPILDPLCSVIICLLIFKVAFDIFRESVDRLVDRSCDPDTVDEMRRTAASTEGVVRLDDIKTRLFGARSYVDIEISADGEISLREAHMIAENVHDRLEAEFPEIKHCTVHVNPAESCYTDIQ